MAQRRKKRTSIRTAAGVAQDKVLARLRALRDDPLLVLPVVAGDAPASLVKIREGLEKVATGKTGFRAKRDKGVVGAVIQSLPLAELESVPRLMDHKVAGKRRFYLVRGHVDRGALLGVQNHDDPATLLLAYRTLAKEEGLHFFVSDRLVCTGTTATPPTGWFDVVGKAAGITLTPEGCGHADGERVRIGWEGGPAFDVCVRCGRKAENLHKHARHYYAGQSLRRPFTIQLVRADGTVEEPERESVAAYRAGVVDEAGLLAGMSEPRR